MDKKYTCRLGEVREKRKERDKNFSNLGVEVFKLYVLEEISDTLAIMLDEMQKNRR